MSPPTTTTTTTTRDQIISRFTKRARAEEDERDIVSGDQHLFFERLLPTYHC